MNYRLITSGNNKRKEYFSLNKSPLFGDINNANFSSQQIKSFENFRRNFSNLFNLYFPAKFSDYNNDVNLKILNFIWNDPRFSEKECIEHSTSYEYKIDLLWDINWHCKKMQFKPERANLRETLETWIEASFKINSFSLFEISSDSWRAAFNKQSNEDFFLLEIKVLSVQEDRITLEFDCHRKKLIELCSIPKINRQGNFIINGHEKVVVFQSVRSPGLYFFSSDDSGKTDFDKVYSEIIPLKGPWVSVSQDVIKDKEKGSKRSLKLKFLNSGVSINFFNLFNNINVKIEDDKIREIFLGDEEMCNSFIHGHKEEKKQTPLFLFKENNSYFLIGEIGRQKLNKRLNIVNRMFGLKLAQNITFLDSEEIILKEGDVLLGENFEIFKDSLYRNKISEFEIPQISSNSSCSLYYFKVFAKNNPEKIISVLGWKDDQVDKSYFDTIDFICFLSAFSGARNGIEKIQKEEDKDRLDNQIIRRVGDLIQNIFDNRLGSFIKSIEDKYIAYISQLKKADLLKIPSIKDFDALLKNFFNSSTLIQLQNQNNPISESSYLRKVSVLGLGGLNSVNASLTVRNVNPSYYGRYDLVETPEGQKVGLLHSLTFNAEIDDFGQIKTPYFRVLNRKITGQLFYLTAEEEFNEHVSHCSIEIDGQSFITQKEVFVRYQNKFVLVDSSKVNYIDSSFYQLNSVNSASIPFFQHNDSTRMLMACNMQKQAVVTLANEQPFVASGTEDSLLKNSSLTVLSEEDGTVSYADSTRVVVSSQEGLSKTYVLDQFVNSNKNSFFTSFIQVRKGDSIKKGQIISHGNYGRERELSLGANLRIAFLTWNSQYAKAGGYEDSIIISSKVANAGLLTSFYNNEYTVVRKNTKHGEEEFGKGHLKEKDSSNLDENGIIKTGSTVKEGDILVGKITPEPGRRGEVEELLFSSVFGDKLRNLVDSSFRLPYGEFGVVRSVKRVDKNELKRIRKIIGSSTYSKNDLEIVKINVTQKRRLEIGDKLTTRFGNKGVVSKIVPEVDMPFDQEGNSVDIVFNPLSVPSRMNIGQLLETLLGLAAYKLGERYLVRPFNTPSIERLKEIFEEAKIKNYGLTKLYDGQTGIPFSHEVLVGYIYTMKLNHMVSDKFHSRNTGLYSLIYQQPVKGRAQGGGQRVGEMEVWALEAHGAAFNVMEMMGAKSDDLSKRREFNRSLIFGDKNFGFISNQSESFNLLIQYLRGLGFNLEVTDWNNKEIDLYKFFERSNIK